MTTELNARFLGSYGKVKERNNTRKPKTSEELQQEQHTQVVTQKSKKKFESGFDIYCFEAICAIIFCSLLGLIILGGIGYVIIRWKKSKQSHELHKNVEQGIKTINKVTTPETITSTQNVINQIPTETVNNQTTNTTTNNVNQSDYNII